jgi:serine/threonine-protein kinase
MGQVWRALDQDLGREVAIKVVSDVFSDDADRLARLEREARLLASLSHPAIAAVYGLHEHEGTRFLAMELVEGEDLGVHLERGPLSIDDALEIARGISEALTAAHDASVIHRDLKPSNVMLTRDGKVKVLDFGLAKALADEPGSGSSASASLAPTMTSGGTRAGVILGSASYMSPEQARGKPVDRRADTWALGCLIYETLTGTRAFAGDTVTDTLAAVVRAEPDWSALPPGTPASIHRLLRRLLEKDPARRLRDAGDVGLELDDALAGTSTGEATSPSTAGPRHGWAWALGGAALTALVALAAWTTLRPTPAGPGSPVRFEIVATTEDVPVSPWSLTLSPDGQRVAWVVDDGAERAIWLREMDGLEAERLPDTEGATYPAFSPDGRSIAFYAKGKIRRIDLGSRRAIDLCPSNEGAGISWGRDGTIVFNDNWLSALSRVSAEGGTVEAATGLDEAYGEIGHWFPQLLPDGEHVLISRWRTALNDMTIAVASLATGEIRELVPRASYARFVAPDRLLFTRAGAIHAVRFDPDTREVSGDPVLVVDGVEQQWDNGLSTWTASDEGTLAYLPGSLWVTRRAIVRVDREGAIEPLDIEPGPYVHAAISPDGSRLATTEFRGGRVNVVIHDLSRGVTTPVPLDAMNAYPVWGPDSREILFDTAQKGPWDVHRFEVDGSLPPQGVLEDATDQIPWDWSTDGRYVVWDENYSSLHAMDLHDEREPTVVATAGTQGASLSPDARWIAYATEIAGRNEVLVRRFPDGERDVRVSAEGGSYPLWGRDGREILYRRGDAVIAAGVSVSGDTLTVDRPRILFRERSLLEAGRHLWSYDRTTDTFVVVQRGDREISRDRFVVVLDWDAGLGADAD